jgi:hypothetical protein
MKYLLLVPAVLLGAAIALYVWAAYDPRPLADWDGIYD